jgi:hypothetical protein
VTIEQSLTWVERNLADVLAGALTSMASYIRRRPEVGGPLLAAVHARLADQERGLLALLNEGL